MEKIIKYIIVWWLMAILDILILIFLVEILNINYLISATLSFFITFFIWFLFQKKYTFKCKSKKNIYQMYLFFTFQIIWLWINIILLFIFVDLLNQNYIIVSIANKFIIFLWNFTMNNKFNFKWSQ